jgi:DNA-binding response OmpR family regulator
MPADGPNKPSIRKALEPPPGMTSFAMPAKGARARSFYHPPAMAPPSPLVGRSILVVDDDARMRESVCEILSAAGYAVINAASAATGLKRASEEQPALVLCASGITGGDGCPLLNALAENPATAGMPVVVMTVAGESAATRRALTLGAGDFLQKPFPAEQLLSVVGTQLLRCAEMQARIRRSLESGRRLLEEISAPLDDIAGCAAIIRSHVQEGPHAEVLIHMAYSIMESARHVQRRAEYLLSRSAVHPVSWDPELDRLAAAASTWPPARGQPVLTV